MIQRIQSIFLLLASGSFFSQFALPFASSDKTGETILQDGIFNIHDNIALLILCCLGGILALAVIFLFRNRPLQIRLSYVVASVALALMGFAYYLFFVGEKAAFEAANASQGVGMYLPILGIVLAILAARFTRKDENLVKSMDRLR